MWLLEQVALLLLSLVAGRTTAQARPGCPRICGGVNIPYPFGTKEGCYLDEDFHVACHEPNPPFLTKNNLTVLDISLSTGELRALLNVSLVCFDAEGNKTNGHNIGLSQLSQLRISYRLNKFTVVGCDTKANVSGFTAERYATGCMSKCSLQDAVAASGACSGVGCCQASIPKGAKSFRVVVSSFRNNLAVHQFNPCSFAFLVEEGKYNFSSDDLRDLRGTREFPVVFDWSVGNKACANAIHNNVCNNMSVCENSDDGPGYLCKCRKGYEGNAYLPGGCHDINECKDPDKNDCEKPEFCHNNEGNYTCACPTGYHGDGMRGGKGCEANQPIRTITGVCMGLAIIMLCLSLSYWIFRKRKLIKLREKFFEQNGGIMLRQQLSRQSHMSGDRTLVFTTEELKKATENYHESRILGRGGQGTVYKGILPGGREVAIKKAILGDQSQIEHFINEVVVLSQINHRNVVKLLGCCLETQIPLLIYEFVTNGTLFDHLHNTTGSGSFLSWDTRLKVAVEIAGALSYLHSSASIPIIHRDIKSANILLDENYTAKVSDFGASRLIPADQEQLTTLVQGTLGYLDPEYFHTSQLNEKSDVYSFGVVMLELLTGQKALSFQRSDNQRHLVTYFLLALREERLEDALDKRLVDSGNLLQVKAVACLARRCVRVKGEARPTMKDVVAELEGLRAGKLDYYSEVRWNNVEDDCKEEDDCLLGAFSYYPSTGGSSSSVPCYSSKENQATFLIEGGR